MRGKFETLIDCFKSYREDHNVTDCLKFWTLWEISQFFYAKIVVKNKFLKHFINIIFLDKIVENNFF